MIPGRRGGAVVVASWTLRTSVTRPDREGIAGFSLAVDAYLPVILNEKVATFC